MTLPDWLTVEQAAAYVGRSLSTVRRLIPGAPTGTVRRQGGKVYFSRAYLQQRYNVTERHEEAQEARTDLRQYIASLEQDNAAKTAIIDRLTETVRQLTAANAALLLARNPQPQQQPEGQTSAGVDWYLVAAIALVAAAIAVVVWLFT